jgi:hypothetical protein
MTIPESERSAGKDGPLILLNEHMVALSEDDPTWYRVIEASILHELVHVGLGIAGDPDAAHDDDDRDRGKAFEREAYGEVVEATCAQEIALRTAMKSWDEEAGVTGVFTFYQDQCGNSVQRANSRPAPHPRLIWR